jgi:hypothetical protein
MCRVLRSVALLVVLNCQKLQYRALKEMGHYATKSLAHHGLASEAALHGFPPNRHSRFLTSSSAVASSRTPRRISLGMQAANPSCGPFLFGWPRSYRLSGITSTQAREDK